MFWKDAKRPPGSGRAPRPSQTYTRLNRRETLEHVAELPTQQVFDRLIELFPDFEPEGKMRQIPLPEGNIEVSWGPQHLRIDLRGDADAAAGQIVTLMNDEFGCRVYDPQGDKRYPLKPTPWNALTPEEAAEAVREFDHVLNSPEIRKQLKDPFRAKEQTRAEREAQWAREAPDALKWIKELDAKQEESRRRRAADHEARQAMLRPIAEATEREHPNGRWRRLGLDPMTLAAVLCNMDAAVRRPPDETNDFGAAQLSRLTHQVGDRFVLMSLGFLEAIPSANPWSDWHETARQIGPHADAYFYGPQRDGYKEFPNDPPMSRGEARLKLDWIRVYRQWLLAALLVDDEPALTRILAWPAPDLPVDDDLGNLTAMDNKYHIYLAMRLRGEPEAKTAPLAAVIRTGKRPRAALLLDAADAALAADAQAFATILQQVLSDWRTKGYEPHRVDTAVSVEGSALWHIARRAGVMAPSLSDDLADMVLR